jgi:hypothetical protein
MSDIEKQLKIKVGALRRNLKDVDVAHKEVAREQARFETCEDEDKKVQLKRVIDECASMIPLNMKRVENSSSDLEEFLAANAEEIGTLPAPEGAEKHPLVVEAAELLAAAEKL